MAANRPSKIPVRVAAAFLSSGLLLVGNSVADFSATPSSLSFSSANPNGTSTQQATVYFRINTANSNQPWSLTVRGGNSTFTNCGFLPVSAVRVACASVSVAGNGNAPTGSCSSQFDLSTSPGTVASGLQGTGSDDLTILINYTLTDAWKYPGKISPSCSLTLNYTVTAY